MTLTVWGSNSTEEDNVGRLILSSKCPIQVDGRSFESGEHAISYMRISRCSSSEEHRTMTPETLSKEGAKTINRLAFNLASDNNLLKWKLDDALWADEASACLRKVVRELMKKPEYSAALEATGTSDIVFTCKTSRNKEGFLTGTVVGDGTKYTGENYIGKTLMQYRNTLVPVNPGRLDQLLQSANIDMGVPETEMAKLNTETVAESAEIDIGEDGLPKDVPQEAPAPETAAPQVVQASASIRANPKRKRVSFDVDLSAKRMAFDLDTDAPFGKAKSLKFSVNI